LRQLYNKEKQLKLYLTINLTIMAYVISEDCIACGTCIDECPMGAIAEGDIYTIDADLCTECGTCADVCPSGAISKG
jgi:ferredoxin